MPYAVRKSSKKFMVVKKSDGKVVGTTDSRAKAEAMIRAIYANTKEGK